MCEFQPLVSDGLDTFVKCSEPISLPIHRAFLIAHALATDPLSRVNAAIAASYTQEYVSKAIGQHQSYMAKLETGQRRLDVVQYIAIANVIGFHPAASFKF